MKTTSKRYSAEFKGKVAMEAVEDRADKPAAVDRDAVPPAVGRPITTRRAFLPVQQVERDMLDMVGTE